MIVSADSGPPKGPRLILGSRKARQTDALALVAVLVGTVACGLGGPLPPLSISNETSIPVTLVVNGVPIEVLEPGQGDDPVTDPLPSLP